MYVSLTAELESRVKAKVESGLYNNASEVIREALRFMETHDDWINEVKLGTDQLDRGEGIVIESKAALNSLFDDITHSD
jgi:antitoxin ParD1/3/4